MARGFKIISGPERGRFYPCDEGVFSLGRDPSGDIVLNAASVSWNHARLVAKSEQIALSDAGSANGITVNQRAIQQAILTNGDVIGIGDCILEWIDDKTKQPLQANKETRREQFFVNILSNSFIKKWLEKTSWTAQLLTILLIVIGLDHLLLSTLFRERLKLDASHIALKTAKALVQSLAERNKVELATGRETLLNVESLTREPGVVAAFVVNSKGNILSPVANLNQKLIDPTTQAALKLTSAEVMLSEALPGGMFRLASPIRIYRADQAGYETIGAAALLFQPSQLMPTWEASDRLYLLSLLFSLLIGFAIFCAIRLITLRPITQLTENIGQLMHGELSKLPRHTSIHELCPLIDNVNALSVRLNQEHSGAHDISGQKSVTDDFFSQTGPLRWMVGKLSEAVLLIGENGTIIALNQRARHLLEVEITGSAGVIAMSAVTNQMYRNFLEDGCQQLKKLKKPSLTKMLEYKDFAYQFVFHSFSDEGPNKKIGPAIMVIIEKL